MKKALLILLLMLTTFTFSACGILDSFKKGGEAEFEFELNEDGKSYSVTDITNRLPDTANFPASYNGLPVTEIHDIFLGSVKNITIPDSITYIEELSLFGCEMLESISVDINNTYFKSIDGNLYTKDGKTLIRYAAGKKDTCFAIPEGVEVIADYAFKDAKYLKDLTIPESVARLGNFALWCRFSLDFGELTEINFLENENGIYYVDKWVIDCDADVTSAILREDTVGIAESAFYDCKKLEEIKIPDTVTVIEMGAFKTTAPAIEEENGIYYADTWAIDCDKDLKDAVVRDDTIGIADRAFRYNANFSQLTLPGSLKYIGISFLRATSPLTSITVDETNACYKMVDNALYTMDGKTLLYHIEDEDRHSYTFAIPKGVEVIYSYAFQGSYATKTVIIPESVRKISESAFVFSISDAIYYEGTTHEWEMINEDFENDYKHTIVYFYSEEHPTESGNFWHYDENGEASAW